LVPAGAQIALGTARDKSDELIPPNYGDLLPVEMKQAFEAETFEWGKIPDWIPPPSLR
jgi:nucleoporin NUP42